MLGRQVELAGPVDEGRPPADEPAVFARTTARPVRYDPVFDEYHLVGPGLPREGPLAFCPWCGTPLRPSQRERWYAEVAELGIDPDDPDFPVAYRSDAWWRTGPEAGTSDQ